ncbi:MAG: hypothetical protein RLZZ511_880 [Cyanobacteriota bacterium]|jgi:hypothetical protein
MKNTVKVGIATGIAGGLILLGMVGIVLFDAQHRFIKHIWRSQESITDRKPTNAYKITTIQGFQVLFDKDLLEDPEQSLALVKQFDSALAKISKVVAPAQLAELKKTRIWISVERHRTVDEPDYGEAHGAQTIAVYRKSTPATLKKHGHNPDKAKSVEVFNAPLFSAAPPELREAVLLHELAHAYHDKVLGADNTDIRDAYRKAMDRGLYNVVDSRSPEENQAYAATNHFEYFAELSVAYHMRNDGFPKDRAMLARRDPIGHALMQQFWGRPRAAKP